jgi:hypothetical protein
MDIYRGSVKIYIRNTFYLAFWFFVQTVVEIWRTDRVANLEVNRETSIG